MAKALTAKERILKERGMVQTRPAPFKHKRLSPAIKPTYAGKPKTALMRYLEQKYGKAIEDMLVSGSLTVVARKLGNEVDTTTISRWIKRFKLRYTPNNLPSCDGCGHYQITCEQGVCHVLMEKELWELALLKRKEVLKDE